MIQKTNSAPSDESTKEDVYHRSDVFISYNHAASKKFAKQLVERLEIEFKAVWFDENDIPAGVNYVNHFLEWLRRSDVVVMIISNEYLTSENCQKELEQAYNLNKRILTLVHHKDFDFKGFQQLLAVRPDLEVSVKDVSEINTVFFCERDGKPYDFEVQFQILLKAIKTDYEYVQQHTNYLIEVDKWIANNRHEDSLLKGIEITKAERWRDDKGTLEPFPTEEQLRFIRLSREEQMKRDEKERKLQTESAKNQRNFLMLLFLGMLSVLVYLVIVTGDLDKRNQHLQEKRIDDTAYATLQEFLTVDNLFADLRSAVMTGDSDLAEQLMKRHEADMQLLSELYPTINLYTTTNDFEIIVDSDTRAVPESKFDTVYNEALTNYEDNAGFSDFPFASYNIEDYIEIADIKTDWYRVAFVPIPDAQGVQVGYLVLEMVNPVEGVIGNLYITLFVVVFIYVILIAIFSRQYFRKFLANRKIRQQNHPQELQTT